MTHGPGAAPLAGRRPRPVRARALRVSRLALAALCLAGCSGPGQVEADQVAEALARRVRVFYERHLATEEGRAGPSAEERASAQVQLEEALSAAGLPPALPTATAPIGSEAQSWAQGVARARNLLLAHGYVFPPVSPGDMGLCLARVRVRETGLAQELWGRTVRYRRVVHARPISSDYATFRALRTGRGSLPPAASLAGPTVFLDGDAIARRAGRGPYLGASPAALSAHLELAQVAALRFRAELDAAERAGPGRGPALIEALERVWLSLLRYDAGELGWRRLRWELAHTPASPEAPWRIAARRVAARVGDDAASARARAPALLASLEERAQSADADAAGADSEGSDPAEGRGDSD